MLSPKQYDLRFKDTSMHFKDAFIGASRADEPSVTLMKKRMAWQLLICIGVVLALSVLLFR
ncbi:MAG: hypothetical protein GX096_14580 [Clostridiales bacterium]|nr:hypothetical protein [Clostridiales bacterium]